MKCNTCRYWEDTECHRYPPDNGFPIVGGTQWCGEWRDREAAQGVHETQEVDDFLEKYKPKGKKR